MHHNTHACALLCRDADFGAQTRPLTFCEIRVCFLSVAMVDWTHGGWLRNLTRIRSLQVCATALA